MKIETGYLYHIKDEFFDIVNDERLMQNHEGGKKRPTYFTIRDNELLWFIPISSKSDKYKKIINKKVQKYGFCNTILIREIMGVEHVILLQNAFTTLDKYFDHPHMINGVAIKVIDSLKYEILLNFNRLLKLKAKDINLFFTDIDKIKEIILEKEMSKI